MLVNTSKDDFFFQFHALLAQACFPHKISGHNKLFFYSGNYFMEYHKFYKIDSRKMLKMIFYFNFMRFHTKSAGITSCFYVGNYLLLLLFIIIYYYYYLLLFIQKFKKIVSRKCSAKRFRFLKCYFLSLRTN